MLLPVALLAALVAVQTLDGGGEVVLDARAAALAAAAFALLLRAPFLVVLLVAALVAAGSSGAGLGLVSAPPTGTAGSSACPGRAQPGATTSRLVGWTSPAPWHCSA
jgi:hypothetical protein